MMNHTHTERVTTPSPRGGQGVGASFRETLRLFVRDEGVFLFCLFMPLLYPLLYAWIYNNEVVREVPVAVVDDSRTSLSRRFISEADASPDVRLQHADDMAEARRMVAEQRVRGIYYIPPTLEEDVLEGRRAYISVYADMAITLQYKALYQTASAVVGAMNKDIRIERQTRLTTGQDEQTLAAPLRFDEVPIFNPSGGYGGFILPAVLMLILQQTMMLGIGLTAGTRRERARVAQAPDHASAWASLWGIVLAYLMVYAVWAAYLSMGVPRLFGLVMLAGWRELLCIMLPYLLACAAFGVALSWMVRQRENVMLLVVFTSVPFLFLSGVSWPMNAIPGAWRGVAWLVPSTFAVRAYVRVASMGASVADIVPELRALWLQVGAYMLLAWFVVSRTLRGRGLQ